MQNGVDYYREEFQGDIDLRMVEFPPVFCPDCGHTVNTYRAHRRGQVVCPGCGAWIVKD